MSKKKQTTKKPEAKWTRETFGVNQDKKPQGPITFTFREVFGALEKTGVHLDEAYPKGSPHRAVALTILNAIGANLFAKKLNEIDMERTQGAFSVVLSYTVDGEKRVAADTGVKESP